MSVASRKFELEAGTTVVHNVSQPPQPTTLEQAVDYIMHSGMRVISDYDGFPDLQAETAQELAESLFEAGSDLAARLARYEFEQRTTSSPIDEVELTTNALHAARQRRNQHNQERDVYLAVCLITQLETGQQELIYSESPPSLVSA